MISKNKVIVLDLDGTICEIDKNKEYKDLNPVSDVVKKMKEYKNLGWKIIISTSRNMNSFDGNLGLINAETAKDILIWLEKHKIPFDEIYYSKPWCGFDGFYVDDKSIRPSEFVALSYEEIKKIL